MNTYQILCLFGIPSLITTVILWIVREFKISCKKTDSVKLGLQALLRAQMISDYNLWSERGYAPIYARENFENCWKQYHGLGANGVMDDIHEKFTRLPTAQS